MASAAQRGMESLMFRSCTFLLLDGTGNIQPVGWVALLCPTAHSSEDNRYRVWFHGYKRALETYAIFCKICYIYKYASRAHQSKKAQDLHGYKIPREQLVQLPKLHPATYHPSQLCLEPQLSCSQSPPLKLTHSFKASPRELSHWVVSDSTVTQQS